LRLKSTQKKKENEIKGRTKGARTTAAAAKLFLALADTRLTDTNGRAHNEGGGGDSGGSKS